MFRDLELYLCQILAHYEGKYWDNFLVSNVLLYGGTIFGPNKVPNRKSNLTCSRHFCADILFGSCRQEFATSYNNLPFYMCVCVWEGKGGENQSVLCRSTNTQLFNDLERYLGQTLRSKILWSVIVQNFLVHRGTMFGPNKIPNCERNWMSVDAPLFIHSSIHSFSSPGDVRLLVQGERGGRGL